MWGYSYTFKYLNCNWFLQELQYAQRYHDPQGGGESSYSEPDDQRPPSILKKRSRIRECKFSCYKSDQYLRWMTEWIHWKLLPTFLQKGDNFALYFEVLKRWLLLKERICSLREQILSFKSSLYLRREENLSVKGKRIFPCHSYFSYRCTHSP